ncbi:MAG: bifunctional hydroxymethylpyrimidine kinase/phosphomethylpyrimidine kinase [Alphaproteobacteria bacterium]|nr:bifunctional hydroxymethylpyrimidine kinase/phosphomethylpyrimidine kinase [Alphaproteobacteria bacterium]
MKGRVLIIAGSDSGGGAGIQADIKTVTALGGYAMTAITAITVQNTMGVFGVHAIPQDVIREQIRVVMEDIGADCIKTGMLGDVATVETVAAALNDFAAGVSLVVDPVMVAKGGAALLQDHAVEAVKTLLLPRADLVTPNAPEAERLTGGPVRDVDGQMRAGADLLRLGVKAALIKGGHIDGAEIVDVLATAHGATLLTHPRIATRATHGTGCTLASAIAAGLAQGARLEEAVRAAGDYVHEAIKAAPGFGAGHGPLGHGWPLTQRS